MMGAGCPPLNEIPTVASWHGLIAQAMRHMANEKRKFNRPHLWSDLGHRPSIMSTNRTPVSRFLDVQNNAMPAAEALRAGMRAPPPSRMAGDLTTTRLITEALERYHTGILSAGPPNNQLSKSIRGLLLCDIYAITGKCVKVITRNPSLRTDNDCALFPLYRSLHWEAAVEFGKVFTIEPDQIDSYLRRQNISMSGHGARVDKNVGGMKHGGVSRLVYLSDEEALAVRLEIEGGKFLISNGNGAMINFDCSGEPYKDISKETATVRDRYGRPRNIQQFTPTNNPARRGNEHNEGLGVAGFAMATNRDIFAMKHKNYNMAKGSIYHSSYLNGREVISTGCITVVAGELKYINNWSGHYQPKPRQIYLVLRAFQTLGVDLTNVMVECQMPTGQPKIRELAPDFMDNINTKRTFDGRNDRSLKKLRLYIATAESIKQVLAEYEEKANKWWSRPSTASLNAMNQLKAISDPKSLVKETSKLLLRGNLGKSLRGRLAEVMAASPFIPA